MENYIASSPRAQNIFNKIQATFARHGITPTPINYLVWYEYFLNKNKLFIEDIDKALANGGRWHDIIGIRLYHSYIKQQCTNIHDIEEELNTAQQSLHATIKGLDENLSSHAMLIQKGASPEQLQALTQRNARLNQLNQNTLSALSTIGKKITQTTDFNFRDPITKLYNQQRLLLDIEKLRPLGNLPPLLMIQMDHFNKIQREHGALVAENLIRFIAKTISKYGQKEYAYRTGVDEFLLMAPTSEAELRQIGEEIRKVISQAKLKRKDTGESVGNFTITGIIFYPGNQDFIEIQDTARRTLGMYKNRDQRDRIVDL